MRIEKLAFRNEAQFRQLLHANPEVSGKEALTAKKIHDWLTHCKPDFIQTEVGGHGLVVGFDMPQPGPTVMFRADIDALPIPDKIDETYTSRHQGVGHKCGHDGHTAIQAGLATLLSDRPFTKGSVWILFQPAEETGTGADAVLQDPFFQNNLPDYVFGLHNLPGYPVGQVITIDDVFAVASVGLRLIFDGQTAHAAHPLRGNSPAGAISKLASQWLANPSPFIAPESWSLMTITHMKLGEPTFGTSPGHALMQCTLRSDRDQSLEQLKEQVLAEACRTSRAFHLEVHPSWHEAFPVTRSNDEAVNIVRKAVLDLAIPHQKLPQYFRWSEDFGHYTQHIKGAFFGLGAGENQYPLHHMKYDFPDSAIPYGVAVFYQIATEILH